MILITCDTLRADFLGCYGHARPTSPRIDELARESIVFEQAWSAAPLTLPSLSALLAGRPPDEIGAAARSNLKLMPASVNTLAEVLRDAGFDTAAFVSNGVLRRPAGLADVGIQQGFRHYDDELDSREQNRAMPERTARNCTDAALLWLATRGAADERCFLWVHYQDPHGPYTPPAADLERFARGHADEPELPLSRDHSGAGGIPDYQVLPGLRHPGEYVERYEAEIHHFDAELGRLLDGLRARGWLDDALLVLTADHGESLGENDYWFCHGETLQPELLHVPLIVHAPHTISRREPALASYLDLWPTVLEFVGLPPIENGGCSLLAAQFPSGRVAAQVLGSTRYQRQLLALTDGRWRLLLDGPAAPQLFDLTADPLERHDLAQQNAPIVARLRDAYHAGPPLEGLLAPQGERLERELNALGYPAGVDEQDH